MSYQCKAESGRQLLARLKTRPSLKGLHKPLFGEGPCAAAIIEVSGDASTGKTLLLTQLLVKCLLPSQWRGIDVGGLGVSAVLVDTDHHLQLLRLAALMEIHLVECLGSSGSDHLNAVEDVVRESLKRLSVLSVHDSTQLIVTLHSLDNLLVTDGDIGLLLLDSISAYYWQDICTGGRRRMDDYLSSILKMICKCVQEHKIVAAYTRPAHFQSKRGASTGFSTITHRITLARVPGTHVFTANVTVPNAKKLMLTYTIDRDGIKWSD